MSSWLSDSSTPITRSRSDSADLFCLVSLEPFVDSWTARAVKAPGVVLKHLPELLTPGWNPVAKYRQVRECVSEVFQTELQVVVRLPALMAPHVVRLEQTEIPPLTVHDVLRHTDRDTQRLLHRVLAQQFEPRVEQGVVGQIEVIVLCMVRLFFILMRVLAPVAERTWRKFRSNELWVVNADNAERLVEMAAEIMERTVTRLESAEGLPLVRGACIGVVAWLAGVSAEHMPAGPTCRR